ncbi:MAG: DbpA RNA binding domain-containing protein, partial [Desulfobulbaceae bacterium]|nr:DbpA RNA binding domain-containing protein [Desulfobulbaceae bacterium]
RAGRNGEAILFITPRERRLLQGIERTARQKLEMMELPSIKAVNEKRISRFKQKISKTMADQDLSFYSQLISEFISENDLSGEAVAAALAHMVQGNTPLLLPLKEQKDRPTLESSSSRRQGPDRGRDRGGRNARKPRQHNTRPESGMERFRVDVGHEHGVKPGNLVGAIANEAGLDSQHIGRINIYPSFSTVDLPSGIPNNIFSILQKSRVAGRPLRISKYTEEPGDQQEMASENESKRRPVGNRRPKGGFDRKQPAGKAKGGKKGKFGKVFRRAL